MNKESFLGIVRYIVSEIIRLKDKYIKEVLPIDYLTIFAHSENEFKELLGFAQTLGKQIFDNNGPVFLLDTPIDVPTGKLKILRIRRPDPERPQKGCGDFRTDNFESFKKKYLNLSVIKRPEYEMIEIKDNSFDVLAYIPSETMTTYLKIK